MIYGDLGKRGFKDFKGKQTGKEVHTHPVILKDFSRGMVLLFITVLGIWRGMFLKEKCGSRILNGVFDLLFPRGFTRYYRFYRFSRDFEKGKREKDIRIVC